mmetsp:Transcript_4748/g.8527  ORF Transcript_4748/g.8527 Transcript_4748/m.8527 type:complete len:161 (+) Transcript_4748:438-920(+)
MVKKIVEFSLLHDPTLSIGLLYGSSSRLSRMNLRGSIEVQRMRMNTSTLMNPRIILNSCASVILAVSILDRSPLKIFLTRYIFRKSGQNVNMKPTAALPYPTSAPYPATNPFEQPTPIIAQPITEPPTIAQPLEPPSQTFQECNVLSSISKAQLLEKMYR